MLKFIYFLISIFIIYIIIKTLIDLSSNKNKEEIFKYHDINNKFKSLSFIKKIQFYINYLSKLENNVFYYIRPSLIIVISIILSMLTGFLSYKFLRVFSSAIIIAIYSFFIPYVVLNTLYNNYRKKIVSIFPTYII